MVVWEQAPLLHQNRTLENALEPVFLSLPVSSEYGLPFSLLASRITPVQDRVPSHTRTQTEREREREKKERGERDAAHDSTVEFSQLPAVVVIVISTIYTG